MSGPSIISIHLALAVLLFFCMNWLGRRSTRFGYTQLSLFAQSDHAPAFNFVLRVLTPVVYALVVSAGLYAAGWDSAVRNIFLIVPYYFGLRVLYNLAIGRRRLINWRLQTIHVCTSSGVTWLAYRYLIITKSHLLPEFSSMANQLWIVIFGFIYILLNSISVDSAPATKRKSSHIEARYRRYVSQYGSVVRSKVQDSRLEALLFALMIYEDFNRPRVARMVERMAFRLGWVKTLGIMQVTTGRPISDEESIALASDLLAHEFAKAAATLGPDTRVPDDKNDHSSRYRRRDALRSVVMRYNGSYTYSEEVLSLYEILRSRYYETSASVSASV